MKKYELLVVLPGTLDDKESEARAEEMATLVKEYAGNVEMSTLGKNRLAYPIKQIRYGYFYTIIFEAEAERLKKLEEKLSLTRDVLRTMLSHFNTQLNSQQKSVYGLETAPPVNHATAHVAAPTPVPAPVSVTIPIPATTRQHQAEARVQEFLKQADAPTQEVKEVKSNVERKIDKLDMDEISKKLDDLISGDVMPGV